MCSFHKTMLKAHQEEVAYLLLLVFWTSGIKELKRNQF
jgi:hypothetical protein